MRNRPLNTLMDDFDKKNLDSIKILPTFATMKKTISYPVSVCAVFVYLITNMGFGVHRCEEEDSSTVVALIGGSLCHHTSSGALEEHHDYEGCHGVNGHCDHCCSTLIYMIDDEHFNVDSVVVEPLFPVLEVALPIMPLYPSLLYETDTLVWSAATIVFGPGGGHSVHNPQRC